MSHDKRWLSMDTAPKDGTLGNDDGTSILAWGTADGELSGPADEPSAAVIVWQPGFENSPGFWEIVGTDHYAVTFKPICWQPITPPK